MGKTSELSQYDLFFLSKDAARLIGASESLVGPMTTPVLGEGWVLKLHTDVGLYRDMVTYLIKEYAETTDAVSTLAQLSGNVSDWRNLGVRLARKAPAPRRDVLMKAVGWGIGSPRGAKELKDALLTISSRIGVHRQEFINLGMAPVLLELPGRVLGALEDGAGDVAKEKAEDNLARADLGELFGRVTTAIDEAWSAAELVVLQARLLASRNGATPQEKAHAEAQKDEANELLVKLEAALGEARVQTRKRAADDDVPPELLEPAGGKQPEAAEESAA